MIIDGNDKEKEAMKAFRFSSRKQERRLKASGRICGTIPGRIQR